MRNFARLAIVAVVTAAPLAALAGTALADPTVTCNPAALVCAGNIVDVHDLITGLPALGIPTLPIPSIPTIPLPTLPVLPTVPTP